MSTDSIVVPEIAAGSRSLLAELVAVDEDASDSVTWSLSGDAAGGFGVTSGGMLFTQEGTRSGAARGGPGLGVWFETPVGSSVSC